MVKRTANGICTIPTAATSCQSACKNYSRALFEIHSRKLTWIPKWWFGKGNSLYKWQFLVSMLDFWGVLTSFAFKEWTRCDSAGGAWSEWCCSTTARYLRTLRCGSSQWPFCVQRIVGPSDLDLWGWLWHIPLQVREVAGFCRFFCWCCQPFPQKDKCNLQKKKSEVMHVVIWCIYI